MSAFFISDCSSCAVRRVHADADARRDAALLADDHDRLHERRARMLRARPRSTCAGVDTSCSSTTNSSPPSRATTSLVAQARRAGARAISFSSTSPASWPSVSLIDLEAVEVDEQHRELALVATRCVVDREVSSWLNIGAIRQAGQPSCVARYWMRSSARLRVGDVLDDRDVVERHAVASCACSAIVRPHPNRRAVLAQVALLEPSTKGSRPMRSERAGRPWRRNIAGVRDRP